MDFSIILTEWPTYWEGFYTTIWLVSVSLMLGLMLAVPMGILRNSRNNCIWSNGRENEIFILLCLLCSNLSIDLSH